MKILIYFLSLLLNIRAYASADTLPADPKEIKNGAVEIKVIVIKEQDFIEAVKNKRIIENNAETVHMSNELYNYLKKSGKIKTLKNLNSVNCGEHDTTF